MRQHEKFRKNLWNRFSDILQFIFLKMTAVRHFGFVGQIWGRPTTRIWWYLSF